jgi:hypothetical protein
MTLIPYKIEDLTGKVTIPKDGEFRPYKVVLEIQNKEASLVLHDRVAIKLPDSACDFIGNICSRGMCHYGDRYALVTSGILEINKNE